MPDIYDIYICIRGAHYTWKHDPKLVHICTGERILEVLNLSSKVRVTRDPETLLYR